MLPDIAALRAFLSRAARRMALVSGAKGAAAGLGVAIVLALFGWPRRDASVALISAGIAAACFGLLISILISSNERRHTAHAVERRAPRSRNLLVTADELSSQPMDGYVPRLVFARAAQLVGELDLSVLFPTRSVALALGVSLAVWALVVARPLIPLSAALSGAHGGAPDSGTPVVDAVDVTIQPPAYTARPKQVVKDPSRIEALAGSTITLSVRAHAGRVAFETLDTRDTLARKGSAFTGTLTAGSDGYIALQPTTGNRAGARRLIGLTVLPDSPPRVRITTPGKDQRFLDGHRTLDIAIETSDDIGLASLTLKFTKVSGSGERFTFIEGSVPLTITRRDDRNWTARASWALDSLKLDPGDMVVYRAVAADKRPSGGTTESDSFIAEILAPGGVAAPGFETDPEQDRYAVSQQMVILKTEKLLADRPTISSDSFSVASQEIAAEQRKVRAEFVFMLGGELADAPDAAASMTDLNETQEAEGEADILAGRNANSGHVALLSAIRAMSRAASSLTLSEPTTALPYEHIALTQLESAFSRTRILLRALTTRERLDLSRRLTGVLTDAVRDVQPSPTPAADSRTVALRAVLSDIASLAGVQHFGPDAAPQASALAERALRVDPSSKALQDVSTQLAAAAAAMSDRQESVARAALDRASVSIVASLRGELLNAPSREPSIGDARLNGALADRLRSKTPP